MSEADHKIMQRLRKTIYLHLKIIYPQPENRTVVTTDKFNKNSTDTFTVMGETKKQGEQLKPFSL